ncbi:MAG: undecaprenyl-diphosphatase [Actinomycetota bacterium]|nr:undecaprenyl-diphosphatase [Actinomycetota bacterium]
MISYFQAIVIGLFQGVTELVPISSLGHSVLLPDLFGWHNLVKAQSADESFYLAFLVALHVATALALLVHFRATWVRIIRGFFSSARKRRIDTPDERLAWLLVVGTIPVGLTGLALEHFLRTVFAKPAAAAAFLLVNGVILLLGERLRRRALATVPAGGVEPPGRQLDTLELREAGVIGAAQTLALFAGISRSGITMVGGLLRGLNHEDAARFSFLLATPIIFAAGVYKIPDLAGSLGNGVRGQALAGGIAAFIAAYVAVRFLERYFERRNLTPFAIYCFAFGAFSLAHLAL